jgi:hypothetical protein
MTVASSATAAATLASLVTQTVPAGSEAVGSVSLITSV